MTRGEKVISFIEKYCVIPEGEHVGKPVKLADFQIKFIIEVYDNPHGTDTAILSIARKNAKTGTIAFILLAHLVGPEAKLNSRIISGALSREQAAEVYNLASKCVQLSPQLTDLVRIVPSSKKLIGLPMGVEYQAISAEGKTAHGKSPILAILDEVGQIKGAQSDFIDAVTTAQGAYENPLLIYISTQAAADGDFFSIQIDDALNEKPPKTVCHVYAADKDAEVLDEEQWYKANPALGQFRSMKDMRKQAEKAHRMPSFENTFRNLNLNQRVSTIAVFVSRSIWELNGGQGDESTVEKWYGGLDLSSKKDLTAFVKAGLDKDFKLVVKPYFWMPARTVVDRSREDREPYDIWRDQGYLLTTEGATVDYESVIYDILEVTSGLNIESIAFDRWRMDVFKKDLANIGAELPLVEFGQGYKDMSPAIDKLEEYLLNGSICHNMHPVLTMCAANAIITRDAAENRKMDKSKTTGRIDGMVALAMAVGAMLKDAQEIEPESPWEDEGFSII